MIRKVLAVLGPTLGRGSAALGADLLVAEAFRDLTIPYTIILPYSRSNFEPNAPPEEARRIDAILRDASTVTTLAAATEPYAQLMEALLRDADALLAVWDGGPAQGPGGTAEVAAAAISRGIPVTRVEPSAGPSGTQRTWH
ncbi:MAG: hypothetical protein K2W85_04360 [Phycisphaerales bacterium]|nr:hypothetical protein [Phycisphaerales bacterium]